MGAVQVLSFLRFELENRLLCRGGEKFRGQKNDEAEATWPRRHPCTGKRFQNPDLPTSPTTTTRFVS